MKKTSFVSMCVAGLLVILPISAVTAQGINIGGGTLLEGLGAAAVITQIVTQTANTQNNGTNNSTPPFTRSLTTGSTGPDVTELQDFLIAQGDLVWPEGVSTGYFGNLTQAAVAKFQADNGITPAAGYFGPITSAKVNSMLSGSTTSTTTTTGSTTSTDLSTTLGGSQLLGVTAGANATLNTRI